MAEHDLTNAEADTILAQARDWRSAGKGVALTDDGAFVGSVSGGCVEGAVVTEGQDVIADGKPRLLDFGISDDQAWEVGLACGGKLEIFIERVEQA